MAPDPHLVRVDREGVHGQRRPTEWARPGSPCQEHRRQVLDPLPWDEHGVWVGADAGGRHRPVELGGFGTDQAADPRVDRGGQIADRDRPRDWPLHLPRVVPRHHDTSPHRPRGVPEAVLLRLPATSDTTPAALFVAAGCLDLIGSTKDPDGFGLASLCRAASRADVMLIGRSLALLGHLGRDGAVLW